MTLFEFKDEMRRNRGRLTKFDTQMEYIYDRGEVSFTYMVLNNKFIGLDTACDIIDKLTKREQITLVKFIDGTKPRPPISDIQLKVIRLINDR